LKALYTNAISTNSVHAGAHRKQRKSVNVVCARAKKGLNTLKKKKKGGGRVKKSLVQAVDVGRIHIVKMLATSKTMACIYFVPFSFSGIACTGKVRQQGSHP
jgi:hypothetical protein